MRRLAPLTALPIVAALAILPGTPAQASCVASVRWQAATYLAAPPAIAIPAAARGQALRGGMVPPCNDTVVEVPGAGPGPTEPPRAVTLRRARDVDPRLGVLYRGALYVTPACNDQLAETIPAPTRLPARCGL